MIKEAVKMAVENIDLSREEMREAMDDIMEGRASDALIASFLTAMKMKGESIDEITGAVEVMIEKSHIIKAPAGTVDTCGTGGDMAGTFNISTTAALVAAASGIPVAKHGNISVSSRSGSANVLESLGIQIRLNPEQVEICLEETGFAFLFAPLFHPAMKHAAGPRRELGFRTFFNLLGPLTNPAGAKRQVIGVYDKALTEKIAGVLQNLKCKHAMVVHSDDGLDEISISDKTDITELKNGSIITYSIAPEDVNLPRAHIDEIVGGNADDNAKITMAILDGEEGPKRNIVLLNAAAAIIVGGKAKMFPEAVGLAAQTIDSGTAKKKLYEIKRFTQKLSA